jgi:hypothetical protein
MKTKLTLSIDPEVVARAKDEAQRRGTSVSDMVETYLAVVSKPDEPQKAIEISPLLKSFSGVIKLKDGEEFDYDKVRYEYLKEKYLRD